MQVQDPQVLTFMQWCQQLLHAVLLEQRALDLPQIEFKLAEIQQLSAQEALSDDLLLALKQISLLLETLPEFLQLRNKLLALDIQ